MKSLNGAAVVAAWSLLAVGGAAHAQEAVQWRVEDGGNGHWYSSSLAALCWFDASALANDRGAWLVSFGSSEEWEFVNNLAISWGAAVWTGGVRAPDSGLFDWQWTDGTPFDDSVFVWGSGNPGCCLPNEWYLGLFVDGNTGIHDLPNCNGGVRALLEWSADCNGDGIVDYGQILDGTYEDANANGVPDCCDQGVSCDPCLGDVNFDGIVNGADISVLLGFWGLNGKPVAADINNDGQVDGADLAQLLGSWGACL